MKTFELLTLIIAFLLVPHIAFADGGGPLLLIINGLAFLYGGVLIIVVEWFLYMRLTKIPKTRAFLDALITNLASTALVGFGVPLLVAALPLLIHFTFEAVNFSLPEVVDSYTMALGTWVMEGIPFPKLTIASTILWWVISFFLTVYVEKHVLLRLWRYRQYSAPISAGVLSWKSNMVTYLGLLIVILGTLAWDKYG